MKRPVALPLPMHRPPVEPPPLSRDLGWCLEVLFLVYAGFLLVMGTTPAWKSLVDNIAINFLAILLEALPFMLLGALAGGLIEVFVPLALVERFFGRHPLRAVFISGAMGLVIPVCECAIVPVVRRLLGKGVPFGAAIAFLLGGPIVNSIVALSTAVAYAWDWRVVLVRLGSGYLIAVTIGLLFGRFISLRQGVRQDLPGGNTSSCGCLPGETGHEGKLGRLRHALEHACDDFFAVGKYLVIGAFIAALLRSMVAMETFLGLQSSPWLAILIMMAMAVALNLCSEADAFIAASFRGLLPGSAQMAFMVLGPMLDLKLLLMYLSLFRKRVIVALAVSVPLAVLLLCLGLEYLLPGLLG
jgi:uncharacterized protein